MSNKLTTTQAQGAGEIVERVVISGDLSKLQPSERVVYYRSVCQSLGLNPLTKPFDYINLNGKLTLYAKRDATDQLRKIHGVNVTITSRERVDDVYIVSAKASTKDGRTDESIGAVSISGLKGDGLANALMKAETKAKRRVTLSVVGLGWLDETETETIPVAIPAEIDMGTGEIVDSQAVSYSKSQPTEPPVQTETEQPANGNGKAKKERPLAPADLYDGLHRRVGDDNGNPATQAQIGLVCGKLEECFAPDSDAKDKRRMTLRYLWNIESAKELTIKQAKVTLDWLLAGDGKGSDGDYKLHPAAPEEAKRAHAEAMKAAGQTELPGIEAEPVEINQLEIFATGELAEWFPRGQNAINL